MGAHPPSRGAHLVPTQPTEEMRQIPSLGWRHRCHGFAPGRRAVTRGKIQSQGMDNDENQHVFEKNTTTHVFLCFFPFTKFASFTFVAKWSLDLSHCRPVVLYFLCSGFTENCETSTWMSQEVSNWLVNGL